MSEAGAIAPPPGFAQPQGGPEAASKAERKLRPPWLRPAAILVALALHAALATFFVGRPESLSPVDAIEVTLLAQGESAEDQKQVDEVMESEPPPPPQPAETAPELAAPPPRIVAPEAVPLPVANPKPVVLQKKRVIAEEEDERPTPAELREDRRKRAEAAERRRKTQAGRLAARRGSLQGRPQATGLSRASYVSLLSAEINRHKVYPSSARAAGVTGSVGVAFTVGPSGRVVGHAITRSSGSSALDGAVHAMMAAVHAPPPPGGRFSTSTTIHFSFQ